MMTPAAAKLASAFKNHPRASVWVVVAVWSAGVAASVAALLGWSGDGLRDIGMAEAGGRVAPWLGLGLVWAAGIGGIPWLRRRLGLHAGQPERREPTEVEVAPHSRRDATIGPADRFLLLDRMSQSLARSHRSGRKTAALYVNLDGLEAIKDALGDDAGDLVSREAAARLATVIRQVDTVARFGDDEFVVILGDLPGPHVAARVANDIIEAIGIPIALAEEEVTVDACMGIAFFPGDANTPEALLRAASEAMREVKTLGMTGFNVADGGAPAPISCRSRRNERRAGLHG